MDFVRFDADTTGTIIRANDDGSCDAWTSAASNQPRHVSEPDCAKARLLVRDNRNEPAPLPIDDLPPLAENDLL